MCVCVCARLFVCLFACARAFVRVRACLCMYASLCAEVNWSTVSQNTRHESHNRIRLVASIRIPFAVGPHLSPDMLCITTPEDMLVDRNGSQ